MRTTSWFFVSTGWLAYFDSWYVLGLLVATFSRSPYAAAAACLLSPWVDERFVLALPLVVLVRGISAGMLEGGISKRFRSEGMLFFALMVPYCSLRLIALFSAQDVGSAAHLRNHFATVHHAGEVIYGLWSGLRALWAFVMAAPVLLVGRGRVVQAGLLVVLVAATLAASVSMATDLSRATSTVVPVAVLGIILALKASSRLAWWRLPRHWRSICWRQRDMSSRDGNEGARILPLHVELDRVKRPPPQLAVLQLNRAMNLGKQRQPKHALAAIEAAIEIDPRLPAVHLCKGMLLDELGRTAEAAACYDRAVSLAPGAGAVFSAPASASRTASSRRREKICVWRSALRPAGSPARSSSKAALAQLLRATNAQ